MRVVVLDTTAGALSLAWSAGSLVSGADRVVRARNWAEAYDGINAAAALGPVHDLQVWGHGNDGAPMINSRPVDLRDLARALGSAPRGATVWWRSCEVHRGAQGHAFAAEAVRTLGRTSVGHCVVVSAPNPLVQGAICALRPYDGAPWWDRAGRGLRSCSTLRMSVPPWAYRP